MKKNGSLAEKPSVCSCTGHHGDECLEVYQMEVPPTYRFGLEREVQNEPIRRQSALDRPCL